MATSNRELQIELLLLMEVRYRLGQCNDIKLAANPYGFLTAYVNSEGDICFWREGNGGEEKAINADITELATLLAAIKKTIGELN